MKVWLIYWEAQNDKNGFVSYDNNRLFRKEYESVKFEYATKYKNKKDAERTMNWYFSRGGFGFFKIINTEYFGKDVKQ